MKNDRLFKLLYILMEKQRITAPELAKLLDVSIRTIYRDIDTLSVSGIPIYTSQGKSGGISLMSQFTIDRSLLTESEQNLILFGLQSIKASDQNINFLLSKLGTVFKKSHRDWIEVDFSRWGKSDTQKFELLRQAILEKRILQISYVNTHGERTNRNIKLLRLVFKSKDWYIQGYCLKSQDFRTFKISRVISLSITSEYFGDEFNEIPPIDGEQLSTPNTIRLKLKFAQRIDYRVYDEFESKHLEINPDGSIVVTVDFPFDVWVYGYILSFGTDVEILEPLSLKKDLFVHVQKLEKHFKS